MGAEAGAVQQHPEHDGEERPSRAIWTGNAEGRLEFRSRCIAGNLSGVSGTPVPFISTSSTPR